MRFNLAVAAVAMIVLSGVSALGQGSSQSHNYFPNPYKTISNWGQLPDGRKWGSTSGVWVGADGNIWTYERCGGNSCVTSDIPPILEFDPSGKLLKTFGAGLFAFPHGLFVDKDGNVWVTDGIEVAKSDDEARKYGKGHQVIKFSPDGKVLLRLGRPGIAGDGPDTFNRPSAVAVAPNGDIFVADGHASSPPNTPVAARILKFSKDGKFIKTWGKLGTAPGEFDGPHALAFDSQGRLFVGDRSNGRIQIFDQDGKFIAQWKQFGRPSGIFIDRNDVIYVADSESTDNKDTLPGHDPGYGYNPGFKRGIRIGSAKDGTVTAFIPDPSPGIGSTSAAEGIAADSQGNIYAAEVALRDVKKYVK